MPFYQRLGDLPRKRHIVHRDNGTLLTEEVMGFEGFSGLESILYHLQSPCRVKEIDEFEPIVREEWVPEGHAHRHLRTWNVEPQGDEITGRRVYHLQDLGGRGLLIQCFTRLGEQPCVLHRNDRLCGEVFEESNLLFRKQPNLFSG